MSFIVVKVDQNYDYVEDVRYIASFPTEHAAQAFVKEKKEEQDEKWRARRDYIEQWVNTITLPETDAQGWKEFLQPFHPFGERGMFRQFFHQELKNYLRTYHSVKLEGYNPPIADWRWDGLHVVHIHDLKNTI